MANPGVINIVTRTITPRLEYVARFLSAHLQISFKCLTEVENEVSLSPDQSRGTEQPVIYYSGIKASAGISIYNTGLLQQSGIQNTDPPVVKTNDRFYLFPAPEEFDLCFDIFSAIFYLISRAEEYLPYKRDQYGRYEADQCCAYRHGFLEEPVVDQWLEILEKKLIHRFPDLKIPARRFCFQSTIDIDSPWAYKNKGLLRIIGGISKSLVTGDFDSIKTRLKVLVNKQADPFDVYEDLVAAENAFGFKSVYFFLSGNKTKYDTNHALYTKSFKKLLHHLKINREIGIHPSVHSTKGMKALQKEFDCFCTILGETPVKSRQHFLLLSFPETYRRLIDIGILDDYTMGYASRTGFRAGTTIPFHFYDLQKEEETNLTIHPFVVMDVTLRQYLGLTPNAAADSIHQLIEKVKAVNGTFTSLWHNESFSGQGVWAGWKNVFVRMVRECCWLLVVGCWLLV